MKIIPCELIIGIDPGRKTGFAVWDTSEKEFSELRKTTFWDAIRKIQNYNENYKIGIIIEDLKSKKGVFGGKMIDGVKRIIASGGNMFKIGNSCAHYGAGVGDGIGAVRRECELFIEWVKTSGIPHELKPPTDKSKTKLSHKEFVLITKYKGKQTNEHSRDAGMLVYGQNNIRMELDE